MFNQVCYARGLFLYMAFLQLVNAIAISCFLEDETWRLEGITLTSDEYGALGARTTITTVRIVMFLLVTPNVRRVPPWQPQAQAWPHRLSQPWHPCCMLMGHAGFPVILSIQMRQLHLVIEPLLLGSGQICPPCHSTVNWPCDIVPTTEI